MPYVRSTSKTRRPAGDGFASGWHLAWAALLSAVLAVLVFATDFEADPAVAALAVVAVAAGAGAALTSAGGAGRVITIVLWTLAVVAAAQMTGGASGPLAVWCLAPLAAATAFRRASLLAAGAAGAAAAAGLSGLSTSLLALPESAPELRPWLSLMALFSVTLGLASGLIALQAESRREARRREDAEFDLREVLDNQPQLLLSLAPSGRILGAFGPALLGGPARELDGRTLADLVAGEDRLAVDEALATAASHGSAEVSFTPFHDGVGWIALSLKRLGPRRLIAAARDARPERARLQASDAAREEAEAQNAGKSRFLANMSHELRTPLNAIMGFSDIMRQRLFGPLGDRYAEYSELIHESGSHLLELINDVLDMSKIEAERFELARESFDAREAVTAVTRLMRGQAERAGVSLRGVLPSDPLDVDADRRAIKQITLNLISNALKFTPRGGSVTVTVQAAANALELIVADSGVGIAPADLERLGRPFEQAGDAQQRAAGSGLGLSLVRALAKLHGGEMTLESAVGEGTTVLVRLPVLEPPGETLIQAANR